MKDAKYEVRGEKSYVVMKHVGSLSFPISTFRSSEEAGAHLASVAMHESEHSPPVGAPAFSIVITKRWD